MTSVILTFSRDIKYIFIYILLLKYKNNVLNNTSVKKKIYKMLFGEEKKNITKKDLQEISKRLKYVPKF